jgi:large subunit ribosomal protein L24
MMERVKKGDLVAVIAGRDKGKQGRILSVLHKSQRVIIEKLGMVKRHTKPNNKSAGGILEKESSVHISNVMPISAIDGKATRVRSVVIESMRERLGVRGALIR